MSQTKPYRVSHLDALEAESIFVMREVMAEFERPVLLFSGGKDSIVMLRLAEKAFAPARIPFPVMHVDTGHNFPEVLEYRDARVADLGLNLVIASVQEAIDSGLVRELPDGTRNRIQTPVLLAAVEKYRFDALFGGARRDEEKARAKERMFSFRDEFGQWDPKNQRPELWSLYNGKIHGGEHMRIFPLSNWTELDVWDYIHQEQIEIPSIYFAHRRRVIRLPQQHMATASADVLSSATGPAGQAKPPLPDCHSQGQVLAFRAGQSAVFSHRAQASGLAKVRHWPRIAPGDDHVFERRLEMPVAFDSRLDHHVDRSAGHDQMLDIVAADEDELAVGIDGRALDHAKPAFAPFEETRPASSGRRPTATAGTRTPGTASGPVHRSRGSACSPAARSRRRSRTGPAAAAAAPATRG